MLASTPSLSMDVFITRLLAITGDSTHSYELAMHRLLLELAEMKARGVLNRFEYETVTGTALDVLFFFNYDPTLLAQEQDRWYRASIIHQMAVAILQTLATLRQDITRTSFYREHVSALALEHPTSSATNALPLQCQQWAPLLANAGQQAAS